MAAGASNRTPSEAGQDGGLEHILEECVLYLSKKMPVGYSRTQVLSHFPEIQGGSSKIRGTSEPKRERYTSQSLTIPLYSCRN